MTIHVRRCTTLAGTLTACRATRTARGLTSVDVAAYPHDFLPGRLNGGVTRGTIADTPTRRMRGADEGCQLPGLSPCTR